MGKLVGQRHYSGKPSAEVEHIRALDRALHEEQVDWFVAQEKILSRPIPVGHPIPAIRGWRLTETGCYLHSLAMPNLWDSPVEREPKNIARKGTAGFWAVKPGHIDIVAAYRPPVVGIVELSGRVVEHEFGWRGEVCDR